MILRTHVFYIRYFAIFIFIITIINLIIDTTYMFVLPYDFDWYSPTIYHSDEIKNSVKFLMGNLKEGHFKKKWEIISFF